MDTGYKTDFHINNKGSYRIYEDIYQMMIQDMNLSPKLTPLSENDFNGRYDWIQAIDNEELAGKLRQLSNEDLELLTLLVIYERTQREIAALFGISQVGILKRIERVKKYFQ